VGTDWAQAEEELGIALPPDYRELVERFPGGTFQGYLDFNPGLSPLIDLRERRLGELRRWRDHTPDDDGIQYRRYLEELEASQGRVLPPDPEVSYPFPLWPEPGGIYPWAEGAISLFFWLRNASDPGSWPVVWCHGEDDEWERFDGNTTEFLIALVTGQIDIRRLSAPIFPPPPIFHPWTEYRPVPRPGYERC
jgi:hypothetical protein